MSKKKAIKILLISCVLALLFVLPGNFLAWQYQQSDSEVVHPHVVELTTEERAWLDTHQPIRVAFDGFFPPYSFINDAGKIAGISYDTILLISKKLNLVFTIDPRVEWEDIYSAVLDKKVDMVATMVKRPERESMFAFTRPYVFKSLVILTQKSNTTIKDRSDLSGKTVALVKDYQYSQRILKDFPDITPLYVDNMRDALYAVESQQADAAISFFAASTFLQNKYLLGNIKFAGYYDKNSSNESIAVRNDWPILASILQKGLDAITEAERQKIIRKWQPVNKLPVDFQTMIRVLLVFFVIFIVLLLWIRQINRQNQRIKLTQDQLIKTNKELTHLQQNLETQVLQRTEQLQNSEQKYRSLVENLDDEYFFYQHDLEGNFTYLSPSISNILGYEIDDFLTHYSTYLTDHPENAKAPQYKKRCIQGDKVPAYEIEVLDSKSDKRSLEILESPLYDEQGLCVGVEGIAHDITLLKQTRDRLNWLSYYDDLTGLANRRLFKDRIEQNIHLAHRRQQQLALLFLDLDRFKVVNDNLGHAVGDDVLKETASRLLAQSRESDISARMGGDEFTLILPDTNAHAAEVVAKKILHSLLEPYILNDQQFILGASIGIAIYPKDGREGETLLQHADSAMYFAKKEKKGYAFCSSELHQINNRRLLLEQRLRKALAEQNYSDNFELTLVYQSRHCVRTGRVLAYEALLRWQHPELGSISPNELIPLAEESGLIVDLSRWVLNRVCMQTVEWHYAGFDFGKISVNISTVELINLDLAKTILQQITNAGARPEWLEIEITESALMKTPEVAVKVMQQLVDAGLLIAIDDFGTGYSSLAYLNKIPASYIKIDQSFIRNALHNSDDQTVVHAITAMSHALGKKVIAEGVESKEQLQYVADNGCDMVQGYWFSQPVDAKKAMLQMRLVDKIA